MTIEDIRNICLSLPGVTEDIKWETHLCFNIGGKIFLITDPDNVPVSASFKTNADEFEDMINRSGFIPAPYLARNKWVSVDDINRMNEKEWSVVLRLSYQLVLAGLPSKIRKQILET